MALLGPAALAMWWRIRPELRQEFLDWHSHEHFPERLALPGFLRASRWASAENDEDFFVLYELASYETLTSPAYRARLNDPTPWSLRMMPEHRGMVRCQSRVLESAGTLLGGCLATLRLSPRPGREEVLREWLRNELARLAVLPGLTGGHLLLTDTPAAPQTEEQRLRDGQDAVADWIVLVAGAELATIRKCAAKHLAAAPVEAAGALAPALTVYFRLSHAATPADLQEPRPVG